MDAESLKSNIIS